MADVARAAGVGRATLYRYYETREALVEALAADAIEQMRARLSDAGLERVSVEEAVERIVRAILTAGDRYAVLVRERYKPDRSEVGELGAPIRAVFVRGIESGVLRDDLPPELLVELFGGLLGSAVELIAERRIGLEDAASAVSELFLRGAAAPGPAGVR